MFIGREKEIKELRELLKEDSSKFVAVYGRRRIGKTLLIREAFSDTFAFRYSGVYDCGNTKQLLNFRMALAGQGAGDAEVPQDWFTAFNQLEKFLENSDAAKKVVFLDEIPWMDAPKSNFVSALEHFWNGWAFHRNDIILVVCGSATSWIVKKIFKNRGGLHNRLSFKINLKPFTLKECEQYASARALAMTRQQILETYMILGGVPYYWSFLQKGKSVAKNIDDMFFTENAALEGEFSELYAALFKNPDPYIAVVEELSRNGIGESREDIVKGIKAKDGGKITTILEDLENCGFIRKYNRIGTRSKYALYQLTDNYTIFYYKFLSDKKNNDPSFWELAQGNPAYNAWAGVSFERVCLQHVPQIREALSINGVITNVCSWKTTTSTDERSKDARGAQVDLLLDRNDRIINLCEMKFASGKYTITKSYDEVLRNKRTRFIEETRTRKAVHITMVTTYGLTHNAYCNNIQSEVTADDLFR